MITSNFLRLGIIVRNAVMSNLRAPKNRIEYNAIIKNYESAPKQICFRQGKVKVDSEFPFIGFEIIRRQDPFAATNHTRDTKLEYEITVALKAVGGGEEWTKAVEDYIIELAEYTYLILNDPAALQFTISTNSDGVALTRPVKVYDSGAEDLQYSYLYTGALRIAKISWFAKSMFLGPSGGQKGYT
jgi:hypothetical protein